MKLHRIAKFWHLPIREKCLLFEAALLLPVAKFFIHYIPIRWYAPLLLGRHMAETPHIDSSSETEFLRRTTWAVQVASDAMPWRIKCFALAVTLKWMLGRRGVPSVLYLGARTHGTAGFSAHAWLRCGTVYLVGGDGAEFGKVSSFV